MGDLLIYEQEGKEVEVRLNGDTVWLTQRQMAEILETTLFNINKHIKRIYADGELTEQATLEDSSIVQKEGTRRILRTVKHYNLDMVISVAYRVNSKRGASSVFRHQRPSLRGWQQTQRRLSVC